MGLFDGWAIGRAAPATAAEAQRDLDIERPRDPNAEADGAPVQVLTGEVRTDQVRAVARGYAAVMDAMPPAAVAMAEEGPDVYRRMEQDAEVSACLFQIRRRIIGRAIEWAPPEDMAGDPFAQEVAAYVQRVTRSELNLRADVEHLLRAITRRYAVAQVVWRPDIEGAYGPAGVLVPDRLRSERAEDFRIDREGTLVAVRSGRPGGLALTPPAGPFDRKYVVHVNGAEPDVPEGVSVLDGVYWEWKFLRAGMGFWLDLLDRFGVPSLVALFESASGDAEEAKKMAQLIASELAKVAAGTPGAIAADSLIVPSTGGRGDDFERFMRFLEKRIRKGILSTTLTVDISDVGARAQGEVSEREVDGVAQWYGDALEDTMARTVGRWTALMRYGPAAAQAFPVARLDWRQPATFEEYVTASQNGIPVSRDAAYTVYNVPRPADEEDEHLAPSGAVAVVPPSGPGGDFADAPFGRRARTPRATRPRAT